MKTHTMHKIGRRCVALDPDAISFSSAAVESLQTSARCDGAVLFRKRLHRQPPLLAQA